LTYIRLGAFLGGVTYGTMKLNSLRASAEKKKFDRQAQRLAAQLGEGG